MIFPDDWPSGCPPVDAEDAHGEVFRVAKTSPLTEDDFKSYHEYRLMMGPVQGVTVDPARFTPFQPSKVLYDFDGPRTFTFLDTDGELCLALWFDENSEAVRYLLVPFSELLLDRLEQGQISIREALEQPRLWVVDVDDNYRPVRIVRTTLANLPQDELPVHGTLLLPSLEPPSLMERSVRLVGRVRELDADLLRFELRDLEGPVARRLCFFDAGLWHDVRDLLGEEVRVEVGGVEKSAAGPVKVTFIGKLVG